MTRKMRMLPKRSRARQAEMDAETTDRLVSAVLEGDSGQVPDPADGSVDTDALEIQSLIKAIRQVATSDSPLPESRVDTIMEGLQREAEDAPSSGLWPERLGMVAGFLACTVTLAAGLLLVGGAGLPGSPRPVHPRRRPWPWQSPLRRPWQAFSFTGNRGCVLRSSRCSLSEHSRRDHALQGHRTPSRRWRLPLRR